MSIDMIHNPDDTARIAALERKLNRVERVADALLFGGAMGVITIDDDLPQKIAKKLHKIVREEGE